MLQVYEALLKRKAIEPHEFLSLRGLRDKFPSAPGRLKLRPNDLKMLLELIPDADLEAWRLPGPARLYRRSSIGNQEICDLRKKGLSFGEIAEKTKKGGLPGISRQRVQQICIEEESRSRKCLDR